MASRRGRWIADLHRAHDLPRSLGASFRPDRSGFSFNSCFGLVFGEESAAVRRPAIGGGSWFGIERVCSRARLDCEGANLGMVALGCAGAAWTYLRALRSCAP